MGHAIVEVFEWEHSSLGTRYTAARDRSKFSSAFGLEKLPVQTIHTFGQLFIAECLHISWSLLFDSWQKFERFLAIGPATTDHSVDTHTHFKWPFIHEFAAFCVVQCATELINCIWPAAPGENLFLFETIYSWCRRQEQLLAIDSEIRERKKQWKR